MARSPSTARRARPSRSGSRDDGRVRRDRLRDGAVRAGGAGLAALGLALVLALASYSSGDPSLNNATPHPPENWLGLAGSYSADILFQALGGAALVIGTVLLAWGGQIMGRAHVMSPRLRVALLPVAVLLSAVALSALPVPDAWPLRAGLGGIAGNMGLQAAVHGLQAVGVAAAPIAASALAGVLAAAALVGSLGFTRAEWAWAGGHMRGASLASSRAMGQGAALAGRGMAAGAVKSAAMVVGLAHKANLPRFFDRRDPPFDAADAGPDLGPDLEPGPAGGAAAALGAAVDPRDPDFAAPASGPGPDEAAKIQPRADARPGRRAALARQRSLALDPGEFQLPGLDLLKDVPVSRRQTAQNEEALRQNAKLLETVLEDFGVKGIITQVRPGPVVTLYELEPAPGVKTSRVVALADDIARSMSAISARVAVVPGRNVIGIELPNAERETVSLRDMLGSAAYERAGAKLPLVLGKDIGGGAEIVDLAKMPHLLIAGTTGSGKSVAINAMILSLLYRLAPDECKLIMIDPKMLELSVYEGIPHLIAPVVVEPKKAVVALKWAVREMETRYQNMSKLGVRNIVGYNERVVEARRRGEILSRRVHTGYDQETGKPIYEDEALELSALPYIVIVVDEMADLMLVAGKDIEAAIQRLAQMARAAGIHLIMATQRPSVDVITGTIKANFPNRISFQVTSKIDSRTILGEPGAEQLLGQGDMLHMASGGRIKRVHGPFVSDGEVEAVAEALRAQAEPSYLEAVTAESEDGEGGDMFGAGGDGGDDLYDQAVALVIREGKASTSFVQRHLQIGYNRAARIIEQMERQGVVSPADRVGRREVLVPDRDEAIG